MFREGPVDGVIVRPLVRFEDGRGWLIEMFRHDEVPEPEHPTMGYCSQTLPGVARGPHEHLDQTDFFAFIGPGDFRLYLWDTRPGSPTSGNVETLLVGEANCVSVIVPPRIVHAYKNVSPHPGLVFNFPNRLYAGEGKAEPVDEIRHEERPDSPFVIE